MPGKMGKMTKMKRKVSLNRPKKKKKKKPKKYRRQLSEQLIEEEEKMNYKIKGRSNLIGKKIAKTNFLDKQEKYKLKQQ